MKLSFASKKLFSFITSHLLIVDFSDVGVLFKMLSPIPSHSKLFPNFSLFRFSVSGLMLRALVYLVLNFVQGDK